jgi:flagellar FliL protein
MADENEEQQEQQADGGAKKKKLLLFGGAGAGVFIIIAAVLWLFTGNEDNTVAANGSSGNNAVPADTSEAPQVGNALYVGMPRPFVFIVPGDVRERTVQIKVQLMVRGEQNEELAKRHIPLIEGTLHQVFSSSTAEELKTAAGKEKLRELALRELQSALTKVAGKGLVEQVLFTSMVMQ